MDKLGDAAIRQTSLLERQTGMLNDHSTTLNVHGTILNVHTQQLQNIADAVGARRIRQDTQTVTMQPAVEVDSTGQARAVVVTTEVIHQQEPNK
jgi:ATP-dependent protease Clp ATPase subunit